MECDCVFEEMFGGQAREVWSRFRSQCTYLDEFVAPASSNCLKSYIFALVHLYIKVLASFVPCEI